jgi:hypothetical protein
MLLERFENFEFTVGSQLEHLPGLALRTLAALHVRYDLVSGSTVSAPAQTESP